MPTYNPATDNTLQIRLIDLAELELLFIAWWERGCPEYLPKNEEWECFYQNPNLIDWEVANAMNRHEGHHRGQKQSDRRRFEKARFERMMQSDDAGLVLLPPVLPMDAGLPAIAPGVSWDWLLTLNAFELLSFILMLCEMALAMLRQVLDAVPMVGLISEINNVMQSISNEVAAHMVRQAWQLRRVG